jgi:hypothetical protein
MKPRAHDEVFIRDKGIRCILHMLSAVSFLSIVLIPVNQRTGDLRRRKSLRALANVCLFV